MSQSRSRRLGAIAAALAVTWLAAPAAFADPTPSPSPSGPSSGSTPALGGWTLSASAAPFTMEIYDPKIPIPAMPGKPNLEFDFSYTRAGFGSGPSGAATSSWLWPGDAIAFGSGTLFDNPSIKYPILTNVQYPGQTPDATMQPIPGSYMQSHTDANGSSAVSTFGLPLPGTGPSAVPSGTASGGPAPAPATTGASGSGGLLGGLLPQPQLPDIGAMLKFLGGGPLVDVQGERSQCSTTVTGNQAVASAESDAGKLMILGGLIEFDGLKVTAKTTSDGTKGTASGVVDYGSMSVAGVTFGITSDGIQTPFGTIALPQLPDAMNQILAPLGISITMPAATDLSKDAQGEMFSHGMRITIDTAVLKKLLPFTPVLKQLIAQVPPSLTSQLPPQLSQIIGILPDLQPRIVMTIGSAKSQAVASAPIDVSAAGGVAGGPTSQPSSSAPTSSAVAPAANGSTGGSSSSGGTSGGDSSGGSSSGGAAAAGGTAATGGSLAPPSGPPVASDVVAPAAFGGLPGQLTVGAFVVACLAAWALRKYSSLLFGGGAGCELGHTTGVPDLRDQ